MMETPTASTLRNQILTSAAAQQHVSVNTLKPFLAFQGDINYAAGMTVFQLAWHITIVLAVTAMIFGPLGGYLARRYGARLPMILGTLSLLISFELWTRYHGAWVDQTTIGVFWGIGFGFYYAASPNLLIDAVPAARQGVSSGMLAVAASIGSALATALLTPILAAHPYYLIATPPGGKPIRTVIPQVYTNVGYTEVYLLIGVTAAAIALVLALALQSGRTPALGGIYLEPSSADVPPGEAAPAMVPPSAVLPAEAAQAEAVPAKAVPHPPVQEAHAPAGPPPDTVVLKGQPGDGRSPDTVALKDLFHDAPAEETVALKKPQDNPPAG